LEVTVKNRFYFYIFCLMSAVNIFAESPNNNSLLEYNLSADEINKRIAAGADVNAKGYDGRTPLHNAVPYYTESVKALIEAGADVNAKDDGGRTPLHNAVPYYTESVKALIEAGADITVKDPWGGSPLENWITNDNTEALEAVSKKYNLVVKVTIKNKTFDLPLQEAMELGGIKDSLKIDGKDITVDISDKCSSDLIFKVNKLPNTKIVEFLERLTEEQLKVFLLSVNNLESVKLVLIANYHLIKEQILNGKDSWLIIEIYRFAKERIFKSKNRLKIISNFSLLKLAYDNNFENFSGYKNKEVAAFLVGHKYAMGTEFDIESNAKVKARYNKLSQTEKDELKMMLK
jgi:hypothetical protein